MSKNKIYIASDHAGVELKQKLISAFVDYRFINLGTDSKDSVDYPDYAAELSKKLRLDKDSLGVLICGSGIGMSIAANRFNGIRAALANNIEVAALSRQHNDANVLVLAARFLQDAEAIDITKTWLNTDFEAGRHQARLDKIDRC